MSALKIAGGIALLIPSYLTLSYSVRREEEPWKESLKRGARVVGEGVVKGAVLTVTAVGLFCVLEGVVSAFRTE